MAEMFMEKPPHFNFEYKEIESMVDAIPFIGPTAYGIHKELPRWYKILDD
ncbi:27005_t:CDS:2, partial [Racocetra persica]